MKKYNIILLSIPKVDHKEPLLSLGILKSRLVENNFTCKYIDWNMDLYNRLKETKMFQLKDNRFYIKGEFEVFWNSTLKEIFFEWLDELRQYKIDWIGVSLLSNRNRYLSIKLFKSIREILPNTKIVVGGAYLLNSRLKFDEFLIENKLADHCIKNDGENALIELLNGNINDKIINGNSFPTKDLDNLPIPNFDDLNIYHYKNMPIMTQRGCVNNCKYCDVGITQKILKVKSGKHIADEMEILYNKYKIPTFNFEDNLINSNLKQFRKLCKELLYKKNKGLIAKRVKWFGQLALSDEMIEEDFKLAGMAGLDAVSIGVESGSEHARHSMNKHFSNKTLYNHLKYLSRYGILVHLLMMVGWVEETEEDFQETLEFVDVVLHKYNNIVKINVGNPCVLNEDYAAWKEYDLKKDKHGYWYYKDNTIEVRLNRWQRLKDLCDSVNGNCDVDSRSISVKNARKKLADNYIEKE